MVEELIKNARMSPSGRSQFLMGYFGLVMTESKLFSMALGLSDPWFISEVVFRDSPAGSKELHLTICPKYMTKTERSWYQIDFQSLTTR